MVIQAIIVAAGKGVRMGTKIPKQFVEVAGLPLIMHTIHVFKAFDPEIKIYLVFPEYYMNYWEEICEKYAFAIPHQVISGGETRFQSVKNGLQGLKETTGLVAIHDGVRPLVSFQTLSVCFSTAQKLGNAIPAIEVPETVRIIDGETSKIINRQCVRLIQTPQVFAYDIIHSCYEQPYSESFTDDASVIENLGYHINLVAGNSQNVKITTPEDLELAEILLKKN